MLEKIGGRKVLVGFVLVLVGVGVELFKGLSPNMVNFLLGMGLGYFAGNVGEHISGAIKAVKGGGEIQAPMDLEPVMAALAEVQAKVEAAKPQVNTEALETQVKAIVNQNAVIMANLSGLTQGTEFLVRTVQGNVK